MKLSRRKLAEHAASRLLDGTTVQAVMKEIAAYLVESGRIDEQQLVVRDIEAQLLAHGIALATVTSARPLTPEAKTAVKELITADMTEVKQVLMNEQIDESVIGGAKIELPGRIADLTVKAKLDKLTT